MTVKELIEELKKCQQDLEVCASTAYRAEVKKVSHQEDDGLFPERIELT